MSSGAPEELTPGETAQAVKSAVGGWGFEWMSDADLRARGKSELGLRGRPLYHLGRAGVLGDVPADVVIAVEAFFPPEVVRAAWVDGRGDVSPRQAAEFYAQGCAEVARRRFPDDDRTRRAVELAERVVDAADPRGLPLFAGWRLLPRPDDAPGRLGLLLNILREHRGGVHVGAVTALGIPPLVAVLSSSYGVQNATFFEWPEPYPDVTAWRAKCDAAEDLTVAGAAVVYDVLSSSERGELAALVPALLR